MNTLAARQPVDIFAAIADPTRREILHLLRIGQKTVGEIAANFATSRPAISKHLRILERAGLVRTTTVGRNSVCVLHAEPLKEVGTWVLEYETLWNQSLSSLKHLLENPNE